MEQIIVQIGLANYYLIGIITNLAIYLLADIPIT